MVSSISQNSQVWSNLQINDEQEVAAQPQVKGAAVATQDPVDALEVSAGQGSAVKANVGLQLPTKAHAKPATLSNTSADFAVSIMTDGKTPVDSLVDELKASLKNDEKALTALNNLLANTSFLTLNEDSKEAVLSQCKNFPNAHTIEKLTVMVGVKWFNDQTLADQQRSAKSIAYMAETAQTNPGSMQATILDNTMGRLLSGKIPLTFTKIDDDPGMITFGYAMPNKAGIFINNALVPAGNDEFPKNDPYAKEAVLSTIPHETSHQVNKDKNRATYKYFQAEYRAWYVGYIAKNGVEPSRQEAFYRCAELIDIYSMLNIAYLGEKNIITFMDKANKFFTGDPLEASKMIKFLEQFVGEQDVDVKSKQSKIDFFANPIIDPSAPAPLPDQSLKPDMDN